eukprot:7384609-Prymnesium_polylepis.1
MARPPITSSTHASGIVQAVSQSSKLMAQSSNAFSCTRIGSFIDGRNTISCKRGASQRGRVIPGELARDNRQGTQSAGSACAGNHGLCSRTKFAVLCVEPTGELLKGLVDRPAHVLHGEVQLISPAHDACPQLARRASDGQPVLLEDGPHARLGLAPLESQQA